MFCATYRSPESRSPTSHDVPTGVGGFAPSPRSSGDAYAFAVFSSAGVVAHEAVGERTSAAAMRMRVRMAPRTGAMSEEASERVERMRSSLLSSRLVGPQVSLTGGGAAYGSGRALESARPPL